MRLLLEGDSTSRQRLEMLNRKCSAALDEIHLREMQLDWVDYLRHKIQMGNPRKRGYGSWSDSASVSSGRARSRNPRRELDGSGEAGYNSESF